MNKDKYCMIFDSHNVPIFLSGREFEQSIDLMKFNELTLPTVNFLDDLLSFNALKMNLVEVNLT